MEDTNLKVTNLRWYPKYHIAAPAGWVNDPNGFCYFDDLYHFFYQHYPYGVEWGPMHWGHVISKDLVNWDHLPIALAPDKDYDNEGVFSGSGIEKDGKFYLMYTGNIGYPDGAHAQKQCLAVSSDGINFEKVENNPIIEAPENVDMSAVDFRDPKVWKNGDKFYAVLGSKTADGQHGEILLFESTDLENWTFKNISARAEGNQGNMWECPNFAKIGTKDVLIMSPMEIQSEGKKFLNHVDVVYTVGKLDYETGIFEHGDFDLVDRGFDFYAPQLTKLPDGRTVFIGWLEMWNVPQPEQADGWAGLMTVPREMKLKGGKLFTPPIDELKSLRTSEKSYINLTLEDETELEGVGGAVGELYLRVNLSKSKKFSLNLRGTATISFNAESGILKLVRDATENEGLAGERAVQISPSAKLDLRIYLDKSSIEIFANDGEKVMSARIYPPETSTEIVFIPENKVLEIEEVTFYQLAQSIPDPRM